ncbi:competence type IV pilus major pilin ComGC [Faecalitalea cylindroides]|uniref:Putative ComG operon protein 3 n=1 Tax=Faecalitalea cylindroides ATCC 27803 TaxID=649755 RepID=U2P7W0_9FIRM|nr:competence type IV pilus major pilin ComGC [Faecalitalea cylindroides]ERK46580.1 putative ComG operon protein 3 [[Eubacterium] cylindroides ATCC 27803] [Faecalitalea cylindroides ATCC 27803]
MQNKKNGFTVLEMMIVMLVIALLLLITLPNIQQKETIIRDKGCQALLDIVDSQIILYEIENLTTPTSVQELINEGYLKEGQDRCPNGETVVIVDGQASTQ